VSVAGRLARLLCPATLADSETIAATGAALGRDGLSGPLRAQFANMALYVAAISALERRRS
jgi:hypothetical protein